MATMKSTECATLLGMRNELKQDGIKVDELSSIEVIDLWLEAAQVYHQELRGVKINEQTTRGTIG